MNALDYAVLLVAILGIAFYGMYATRGRKSLSSYLKGSGNTSWVVIGLSVMATQASAITFLSTPGQGYESGLGFVQNYFGATFALIIISAIFLPIYRRQGVYTAYEYLGQRFDGKTRMLGAALFLAQRGLGAGLTIYAPAIVLSSVLGWPLAPTIIATGLLVTIYTVAGGSDGVSLTQKYQFAIIMAGMVAALVIVILKLPPGVSFSDALHVAGGMHKLEAVNFSLNPDERYTFWTGSLGGLFLALSYFGTDQSQVQRYLSAGSLRESRLGLMFNAVFKIPMQFFILLLGVLIFAFYQFERPPVYFNEPAWALNAAHASPRQRSAIEADFAAVHEAKRQRIVDWLAARRDDAPPAQEEAARAQVLALARQSDAVRTRAKNAVSATAGVGADDKDYMFITFILRELPHGLIGLLIAAFFAAALSSKAAELNSLASTTVIDVYRRFRRGPTTDAHDVVASKAFTLMWGLIAVLVALGLRLAENLIQALNILGSIFYGPVLGLFLIAFFVKRIGGSAAFWGTVVAQILVVELYFILSISYLWYNIIGAAACIAASLVFELVSSSGSSAGPSPALLQDPAA